MLILSFSVCAVYAATSSSQYYECYTHEECRQNYHEKVYCYVGTCTDTCPPGYNMTHYGNETTFKCDCNTDRGLVVDGYFDGVFTELKIPMCSCSKTYCTITVKAKWIGFTDGLIPKGSPPNCKQSYAIKAPDILSRFVYYVLLVIMIVFLFVNCRSASCVIYDFHRYIAFYTLASMSVIVFVDNVAPFSAGFTRSMAFGVIIHNSAEWNLILRLNFGKTADVRNATNMCVFLYYIILLVGMIFIPLPILLYVGMIQGGFLDFALFFFVFAAAGKVEKHNPNWQPILSKCFPTTWSSFVCGYGLAAGFHVVTVIVLFVGFVLNHNLLIRMGSMFLVPTFFLYTVWVYSQDRLTITIGPSLFMNYKKIHRKGKPDYRLVPFLHTTQTSDLMWQVLMRNQIRDDSYKELTEHMPDDTSNKSELNMVETPKDEIVVNDCENFKFGIQNEVLKCYSLPVYWIAALIAITIVGTLVYMLPRWANTRGCDKGYDYGAW